MVANIWVAASDGDINTVLHHLQNGFTANSQDPNGYTPVHAAASYAHGDLLKKLVTEFNGDINIRDGEGDTPLHHVEDINTAKLIIEELGGNWKLTNEDGQTPLQVLEEDEEFPELIAYLRTLQYDTPLEPKAGIELPENMDNLRFMMGEEGEADPERRKRVEEILNSENPEAGLLEYIKESMMQMEPEEENKKAKQ